MDYLPSVTFKNQNVKFIWHPAQKHWALGSACVLPDVANAFTLSINITCGKLHTDG